MQKVIDDNVNEEVERLPTEEAQEVQKGGKKRKNKKRGKGGEIKPRASFQNDSVTAALTPKKIQAESEKKEESASNAEQQENNKESENATETTEKEVVTQEAINVGNLEEVKEHEVETQKKEVNESTKDDIPLAKEQHHDEKTKDKVESYEAESKSNPEVESTHHNEINEIEQTAHSKSEESANRKESNVAHTEDVHGHSVKKSENKSKTETPVKDHKLVENHLNSNTETEVIEEKNSEFRIGKCDKEDHIHTKDGISNQNVEHTSEQTLDLNSSRKESETKENIEISNTTGATITPNNQEVHHENTLNTLVTNENKAETKHEEEKGAKANTKEDDKKHLQTLEEHSDKVKEVINASPLKEAISHLTHNKVDHIPEVQLESTDHAKETVLSKAIPLEEPEKLLEEAATESRINIDSISTEKIEANNPQTPKKEVQEANPHVVKKESPLKNNLTPPNEIAQTFTSSAKKESSASEQFGTIPNSYSNEKPKPTESMKMIDRIDIDKENENLAQLRKSHHNDKNELAQKDKDRGFCTKCLIY